MSLQYKNYYAPCAFMLPHIQLVGGCVTNNSTKSTRKKKKKVPKGKLVLWQNLTCTKQTWRSRKSAISSLSPPSSLRENRQGKKKKLTVDLFGHIRCRQSTTRYSLLLSMNTKICMQKVKN